MDEKFQDPHIKIDAAISKKRDQKLGMGFKSSGVQRVYDNINFAKKVMENPITTEKYDKTIYNENISLNEFLKMRIWPRSIYVTDKLLRLAAASRLEFLKRYLAKKRKLDFNWLWLIILFVGIAVAMVVIIFLLPMLPL